MSPILIWVFTVVGSANSKTIFSYADRSLPPYHVAMPPHSADEYVMLPSSFAVMVSASLFQQYPPAKRDVMSTSAAKEQTANSIRLKKVNSFFIGLKKLVSKKCYI